MPIDEKPSRNEDEYFVKQDAELMRRLRAQRDAERAEQFRADLNKCPRCGTALEERERHSVKIDVCPSCEGVWLDKGELEILAKVEGRSGGVLGSFFCR